MKKSLAKLIELKEAYDLGDIWRIRNKKTKKNFLLLSNLHPVLFNPDMTVEKFLDCGKISRLLKTFLDCRKIH